MTDKLGRITPRRLTGSEPLHEGGRGTGRTVLDFWQWAGSDLVGNTFRGWLAEYVVAMALETGPDTRSDWGPFDIRLAHGTRIEVKAAAYIQNWAQDRLSTPRFSIRRAFAWDSKTGTFSDLPGRNSDVYVFCLHEHADQETLDPLDLSQWTFFVLPTRTIEREATHQKSIGIAALRKLGARQVTFGGLRHAVDAESMRD